GFSIFPNWASLYYLRHLLKNQPILFFSTKVYTSLLIIGGANLFYTDEYDVRLLFICSLLAAAGQFSLGKEYSNFTMDKLNFQKNFPLSLGHIFRNEILAAFWLVLIDLMIIMYHWIGKVPIYHILGACLFFLFSMLFWMVFSQSRFVWDEKYMKRIYFLVVFLFVLVMFNVPMILFGLTILAFTWGIFKRNYFTFEPQPTKTT
ncbi:MAG: hypothetical protein ACI9IP_003597, partial [Arcticibacterium sp.]